MIFPRAKILTLSSKILCCTQNKLYKILFFLEISFVPRKQKKQNTTVDSKTSFLRRGNLASRVSQEGEAPEGIQDLM